MILSSILNFSVPEFIEVLLWSARRSFLLVEEDQVFCGQVVLGWFFDAKLKLFVG